MKQFLRYQISGSVFLMWVFILYFYGESATILGAWELFLNHEFKISAFSVLFVFPIGVIIHQFSVLIKNCFLSCFWSELSDSPHAFNIDALDYTECSERAKYYLKRISNLNSFYYVRFDNGFLAPLLSFLFYLCFFDFIYVDVFYVLVTMLIISVVTVVYILKIVEELGIYKDKLQGLASHNRFLLKE